jgi:hypothetical protein
MSISSAFGFLFVVSKLVDDCEGTILLMNLLSTLTPTISLSDLLTLPSESTERRTTFA